MTIEKYNNQGLGDGSWYWPAVHPEGRKFAIIAAAVTLVFFILGLDLIAWPLVGVTIWVLAFFRDPVRVSPTDPSLIIAPADGKICLIKAVEPPAEMRGPGGLPDEPVIRVSIFMSVFDVHINRTPIEGHVRRVEYIPGKFVNADLDKASEDNERQHFLVEREDGVKIGFTQIAGLVARRIVPFVKPGDFVAVGQRVGLIRFGSRVDVFLPAGTTSEVVVGQRTLAGETVLGRMGQQKLIEAVAQ